MKIVSDNEVICANCKKEILQFYMAKKRNRYYYLCEKCAGYPKIIINKSIRGSRGDG